MLKNTSQCFDFHGEVQAFFFHDGVTIIMKGSSIVLLTETFKKNKLLTVSSYRIEID